MKSRKSSFITENKTIRLEGFGVERIITQCVRQKIDIRNLIYEDNTSVRLKITQSDLKELERLAGRKYRITVIGEGGFKTSLRNVLRKKTRLAGILLFLCLIYYQSCFVAEIRIEGYSSLSETEIRQCLKEAGLFEGARIEPQNLSKIKNFIYETFENVSWASAAYDGRLAMITVIEAPLPPEKLSEEKPCHIVADAEGYIHEITPEEGKRVVEDNTYVKPGDILISGIIPLSSTAYGTDAVNITERYVHALGSVKAKVPYRLEFYQERYNLIKNKTGKNLYGLKISMGDRMLDTLELYNPFELAELQEKEITDLIFPLPFKITVVKAEEVEIAKVERTEEEIMAKTKAQIRTLAKEKFPENAQILNNSLNFSRGENIIEVVAILEVLQEIGKEQEIVIGEPESTEGNNSQVSD